MIVLLRIVKNSLYTHTDKDKTQNPNKEMCHSNSSLASRRRLALLNWPHMSESAALVWTHQAAGFISNKSTSSRIHCGCLCSTERIWFFFCSGWQTSGLSRLGWKSHHCAVGLEERGEAVDHAVSTSWCALSTGAFHSKSILVEILLSGGGRNLDFKSFISGSTSRSAIFFLLACGKIDKESLK